VERITSREVYSGPIASVRIDSFRYADGSESERQIVSHPGAVVALAVEGESIWLVRQPREAVGEPALLELPAGKLDVEGETHLECMQRELEEEIGMQAEGWRELKRFYMSPGFTEEQVTLFLATGLSDVHRHEPDPSERIEVVEWPLARLDAAIAACEDAKSLIGLLMLPRALGSTG